MDRMSRLASMALVCVLVAACGAQASSPTAAPATAPTATPVPSTPAASDASSNRCKVAVTFLEAFTQRMADELSALRPLVVAKSFDSAKTVAATRRTSATLTAYAEIEQMLRACEATTGLAARVERLRTRATVSYEKSRSAGTRDARAQRAAAANHLGLLREVLALSKAGAGVADELGIATDVAQVPKGATKPIGKLPPLATPKAPSGSATGGGTSSGGYSSTASRYLNSLQATYSKMVGAAYWPSSCAPGSSPEMCTAIAKGERLRQRAISALGSHLRFMEAHPAACLRDAYAADHKIARMWKAILTLGTDASGISYDTAVSRQKTFGAKLSSYLADCRQ